MRTCGCQRSWAGAAGGGAGSLRPATSNRSRLRPRRLSSVGSRTSASSGVGRTGAWPAAFGASTMPRPPGPAPARGRPPPRLPCATLCLAGLWMLHLPSRQSQPAGVQPRWGGPRPLPALRPCLRPGFPVGGRRARSATPAPGPVAQRNQPATCWRCCSVALALLLRPALHPGQARRALPLGAAVCWLALGTAYPACPPGVAAPLAPRLVLPRPAPRVPASWPCSVPPGPRILPRQPPRRRLPGRLSLRLVREPPARRLVSEPPRSAARPRRVGRPDFPDRL